MHRFRGVNSHRCKPLCVPLTCVLGAGLSSYLEWVGARYLHQQRGAHRPARRAPGLNLSTRALHAGRRPGFELRFCPSHLPTAPLWLPSYLGANTPGVSSVLRGQSLGTLGQGSPGWRS